MLKRFAYFYHLFFALYESFVGSLAHDRPIGHRHQVFVHLVEVCLVHSVFGLVGELENETLLFDIEALVDRLHGEQAVNVVSLVALLLFFVVGI